MGRTYQHLLAAVDPTVERETGGYTAYQIDLDEYVGVRAGGLDEAIDALYAAGYTRHRLFRAAKYHPAPHRAVDHGSFRRIPSERPEGVSDALAEYDPRRTQLHVHVWPTREGVEHFAHFELRGDPWPVADETLREAYDRARTHYRPEYGVEYLEGVTDLAL